MDEEEYVRHASKYRDKELSKYIDREQEVQFYVKCFPGQTAEEITQGLRKYHPNLKWRFRKVRRILNRLVKRNSLQVFPPDNPNPAYVGVDMQPRIYFTQMWERFQVAAGLRGKWDLIKDRCTKEQIEGIRVFIGQGTYADAAGVAGMSCCEFMDLLEELGLILKV